MHKLLIGNIKYIQIHLVLLVQSYVEDNGNLALVADPSTLRKDILQLDLPQARRRTQVTASLKEQARYDVEMWLVFLDQPVDHVSLAVRHD